MLKPSDWIYKEAERLAKSRLPLEPKPNPNPQDILYALMEYLDNSMDAANLMQEQLNKNLTKKGKAKLKGKNGNKKT